MHLYYAVPTQICINLEGLGPTLVCPFQATASRKCHASTQTKTVPSPSITDEVRQPKVLGCWASLRMLFILKRHAQTTRKEKLSLNRSVADFDPDRHAWRKRAHTIEQLGLQNMNTIKPTELNASEEDHAKGITKGSLQCQAAESGLLEREHYRDRQNKTQNDES